ncbi:MAG: AmmeMemoRadiSam system protein B [Bacteroidetes bacterium GWA2_31_9b]|nr:MAG: AmmeMemoRadiSam system protein B [Bacteroidetes bacterium GWA2_31_9b]
MYELQSKNFKLFQLKNMVKIRKPAVAGKFYPSDKDSLTSQISTILKKELPNINLELKNKKIIGGVIPHAGYMFSAYEAVHFFEILKQSKQIYETIVIINPNHTGIGHEIAFDSNDIWETPLGQVELDTQFGKNMGIPVSEAEQMHEHSGEVMVPLLQLFLDYPFKIVPITLSNQNLKNAKLLATKIAKTMNDLNRKILMIASSDFSHFLSPEKGKKQDSYVIEQILAQNTSAIEQVVREKDISVCGYGPIMTLIEYAKLVTEKPQIDILRIGHSGEIIPSSEVVDYVSFLFSKE